jgi:arabinofuranosyltransferase
LAESMGMNDRRNIILIAAVLLFIIFIFIFWDYSIDDAFVTFRYAENLTAGHGLTFNPGDKPVEGYSNFLWLILLSLLHLIGLPTYWMAKTLGILFFLLTGILWWRYTKKENDRYKWLVPVLFIAMPMTAFWGVSGLELGLYALLISGAVISILSGSYWSALCLPLIVFSRPEGFIIAPVIWGISCFFDWRQKQLNHKKAIINIAVIAAATIFLFAFRLYYFGYPMPNTFYVKSGFNLIGFSRLAKMLLFIAPLTFLFILELWYVVKNRLLNKEIALFAGLFIMQAIISSLAIPIMNFHLRYLIPFIPFFLAISLSGIIRFTNQKYRSGILVIAILSIFIPLKSIYDSVVQERQIISSQTNLIKWLDTVEARKRISMTDMGRIPYYTKMDYNDLWGLLSEDIAHRSFSAANEFLRLPDYFIFVGDMEGGKISLRFGKERMIYNLRRPSEGIFTRTYDIVGVASPEGVPPETPGYHYIVFAKNAIAVDSLKAGLLSK